MNKMCFIFLTGLLYASQSCLDENESNSNWTLMILNTSVPDSSRIQTQNACAVTYTNGTDRFTMCFSHIADRCSYSAFNDIPDAATLQDRTDDLTFISINFGNCSGTTGALGTIYGNLNVPTSMMYKNLIDFDGPYVADNFTYTTLTSCRDLGLLETPFVSPPFERLVVSDELIKLKGVETDLALIPATTNACINDLGFQAEFAPIIQNLNDSIYRTGIACSHQATAGYNLCNW